MSEYIIDFDEKSSAYMRILVSKTAMNKGEIVRCRDCKYYELVPEDSGDWCEYWTDRVYGADGFCAWGERRREGDAE